MGYDLPAAIGACFASGQRIILITGEGSIMMNLQELQTIVHHQLPIKIFLLNNNGYLAIKNSQNAFFDGRLAAVNRQTGISFPRFDDIANAFNIPHRDVYSHSDVEETIEWTLGTDGPCICELHMSPNQPLIPKVSVEKLPDGTLKSRPLEDMAPLLSREEFNLNMSISK
jgi:acetolactate synthase-1/2/3 large subunit